MITAIVLDTVTQPLNSNFTMKFLIFAAIVSVASAVPYAAPLAHSAVVSVHQPTVLTTHAQTVYAPLTASKYGSQVNHIVPVPAPIIKGVPQPYAVPVPQPYAVPRAVPVGVPRAVPVDVPRAVPVPIVAQAAPLVTKSVVQAGPIGYAAGGLLDGGLALGGYAGGLGYNGLGYAGGLGLKGLY